MVQSQVFGFLKLAFQRIEQVREPGSNEAVRQLSLGD